MASFEQEKNLVERLLLRLGLDSVALTDPNAIGKETGIDVVVHLTDGRLIGVQVTALEPYPEPGKARAEEKRTATQLLYGGWAQNDPQAYLDSLAQTIARKTSIAEKHSFQGLAAVWLLVCAGLPEHGGVVSTFVMTPCLHEENIDAATGAALQKSKYDCCFFLPILCAERAFYRWEKGSAWKKSVVLQDVSEIPRSEYVNSLMAAAAAGDQQEINRLCDEECKQVLREMRKKRHDREVGLASDLPEEWVDAVRDAQVPRQFRHLEDE
jgi:hypothetical protein